MSKTSKFFSKVALLLLVLSLFMGNGSVVKANPVPTIQIADTPPVLMDGEIRPNTGSAGIAWASLRKPRLKTPRTFL